MSALSPGLYRATVKGTPDQIVMLTADNDMTDPWVSLRLLKGGDSWRWHTHEAVTDARPLIVLDLHDYAVANVVEALRGSGPLDGLPDSVDRMVYALSLIHI